MSRQPSFDVAPGPHDLMARVKAAGLTMVTRRQLCFLASTLAFETRIGSAGAATNDDAMKIVRIATLGPGTAGCPPNSAGAAFARGLNELGYDPVRSIESRCFSEIADLPRLASELLNSRPALFVVWGSVVAVRRLHEAAPAIPIVFVDVTDPVQFGLVKSLSRPGGDMTGLSNITDDLLAKRVEILRDAFPRATRIALLCNLTNPLQADYVRTARVAAGKADFEARTYSVHSAGELASAFAAMQRDQVEVMILQPDAWFFPIREQVIGFARTYRIPAIYGNSLYPELGALFTYGANLDDMSYRAAAFVDKILKGAKPADIPVQLPVKFDFVINAKTARELGLSLSPAVMLRATRVIVE